MRTNIKASVGKTDVWWHNDTRLMASFPEQPGYASTRKVKPSWILMKQEMMGCHMQIIYTSL